MANSHYIVEVTTENFEQVVLQGSMQQPVVVDFWAEWCNPCQMLMPILAKLAEEYQGKFILAKVNSDEQQQLAATFGVRSLPTVKIVNQGQVVDEFMGAIPESQIRELLANHISVEQNSVVTSAEALFSQGQEQEALELIAAASHAEPDNLELRLGHATLLLRAGDVTAANLRLQELPINQTEEPEVLRLKAVAMFTEVAQQSPPREALEQTVASGSGSSEAIYQLAAHQIVSDQLIDALELLLTLMRQDRGYGDGAAHKGLLAIFNILGDAPEVGQYRRRLFNLLH